MDGYEVLDKLGSGSFGTIRRIIRKSDRKVLPMLPSRAHLLKRPRLAFSAVLLHCPARRAGSTARLRAPS